MDGSAMGYGYSWWLLEGKGFMAHGIFGQILFVDPSSGVVIVKLSAWDTPWDGDLELECYSFFDGVVRELTSMQERQ